MKTTILVFHPNLTTTSTVNKLLAQTAKQAGFEVYDMYSLYSDFKIDVKAQQKLVEQSKRIVLQFPIYWYQVPPLLKQWFDDVLEYGWAYGSTGKALQGKELLLVPSFGGSLSDYQLDGRCKITIDEVLKPIQTIQYYTGSKFLEPFVTSSQFEEAKLQQAAKKYLEILKK